MILEATHAAKTAQYLLQIKAIKLEPHNPFTWASGWRSPIYCDNRISLSYPDVRGYIRDTLAEGIRQRYPDVEAIAGVATGAIAMGILVAEAMDLPFAYVRPEPKKHGRRNQIEGHLPKGRPTVVIEDLISTGGSSLKAVEALRAADVDVLGMAAIFTYGFAISEENFRKAQCPYFCLSDYDNLLQVVRQNGEIDAPTLETLQEWRRDPENWNP